MKYQLGSRTIARNVRGEPRTDRSSSRKGGNKIVEGINVQFTIIMYINVESLEDVQKGRKIEKERGRRI